MRLLNHFPVLNTKSFWKIQFLHDSFNTVFCSFSVKVFSYLIRLKLISLMGLESFFLLLGWFHPHGLEVHGISSNSSIDGLPSSAKRRPAMCVHPSPQLKYKHIYINKTKSNRNISSTTHYTVTIILKINSRMDIYIRWYLLDLILLLNAYPAGQVQLALTTWKGSSFDTNSHCSYTPLCIDG